MATPHSTIAASAVHPSQEEAGSDPACTRLASGRSVIVKTQRDGERIEIRNSEGAIEVEIVLDDRGPIVRMRSARLELETLEVLSVQARRIEWNADEALVVESGGGVSFTAREFRVDTEDDVHVNGRFIRLNSPPREEPPAGLPPGAVSASGVVHDAPSPR